MLFASRGAGLFREAHDALAALGPAPPAERRGLWVGGLGHWTARLRRLEASDYAAPSVPISRARSFRRVRLAPSALLGLSGRAPAPGRDYTRPPPPGEG